MRRPLGWLLVLIGASALTWSGFTWGSGQYQRVLRALAIPSTPIQGTPALGATLGLLEVPRLKLSVAVVEGDDESSLLEGAGHLPDTPMPWARGNSVLAGHRDMDFRPLRGIKKGDMVRFRTADLVADYVVLDTLIVEPSDVSVLRATARPILTLITCYPFAYVGPAPKRFVVRAERISPYAGSEDPALRTRF